MTENNQPDALQIAAATWTEFLDHDFEPLYDAVFKPRGYSRDAALGVFMINNLRNSMEFLLGDEDDTD